jgi:hypothetical protein
MNMMRLTVLPIAIATFVFACGGPSDEEYATAAQGLAPMVEEESCGETTAASDAILAVRGDVPLGFMLSVMGKFTGTRGEINSDLEVSGEGDVKLTSKGKSEGEKWKIEVERKTNWKVTGASGDTATINGSGEFFTKVELKSAEAKSKLELDYDAQYHDVRVRTSDRAVIGGRIEYDVRVKEMEKTDATKVKADYDLSAEVEFAENAEPIITLDATVKYKVKANGDVEVQ